MDPRYKSPTAPVDRDELFPFHDIGTLTSAVVWLLRIGAAVSVLSLVSSWMQLDLLSHPYTEAQGVANDKREGAVGGFELLVTLATFITFGRWIVVAHRNLPALGAQDLEFRPAWAIGWFFVPIANLWKPYQAMRTLWQHSRSAAQPQLQDSTWVLPVWWTFWIISSILGQILMRTTMSAETVEQLTTTTRVTMLNCIVDVVLYSVASILVGRIWQFQQRQRANPAEFAPAPGFADGRSG